LRLDEQGDPLLGWMIRTGEGQGVVEKMNLSTGEISSQVVKIENEG